MTKRAKGRIFFRNPALFFLGIRRGSQGILSMDRRKYDCQNHDSVNYSHPN